MSRFKIINLFDKVFITAGIFLIIYAWINFFIRNLWATFLLSLIFTFASVYLLFFIATRKNKKALANKNYHKDMEEKFLAFKISPLQEKLKLLNSIISKSHETHLTKKNLTFQKDNKKHQVIIAYQIEKLSNNDLINLLEQIENNIDVLQIFCNETQPPLNTKILKEVEIEIISKKRLYDEYFLPHSIYPDSSKLNTEKSTIKLKEILKNFITPSKAKSYFLCGLILIFSSIILPYHYYYLIFGTILLILSIVCKLQPLFNH